MEFDRLEAIRVGQELKRIRRQRGLSLAEVEALSSGRWKAVVIGSYERADRAISVGRLSSLMAWYQTPMSILFPMNPLLDSSTMTKSASAVIFDLRRRGDLSRHYPDIARLIEAIINIRGDWNGHLLTLRESDLRLIAMAQAVSYPALIEELGIKHFLWQLR